MFKPKRLQKSKAMRIVKNGVVAAIRTRNSPRRALPKAETRVEKGVVRTRMLANLLLRAKRPRGGRRRWRSRSTCRSWSRLSSTGLST